MLFSMYPFYLTGSRSKLDKCSSEIPFRPMIFWQGIDQNYIHVGLRYFSVRCSIHFFSVYWVDAFLVGWMVHSSMTRSFFSFSGVIFFQRQVQQWKFTIPRFLRFFYSNFILFFFFSSFFDATRSFALCVVGPSSEVRRDATWRKP